MMSDDLVKRLREDQPVTQDMVSTMQCALQDAAASRIEQLEAKLKKAVEALDESVYLLAPDEKDMMRQAGVYRIVTTLAELKGQDDG